jgi:hypothetical protein
MEAIYSSETLCHLQTTWPYNPKDRKLYSHHHENLKSNMKIKHFHDKIEEYSGIYEFEVLMMVTVKLTVPWM